MGDMISPLRTKGRARTSVLVVHVSHAVGGVLGQRLAGSATVVLTDVAAARRILRHIPAPDVVVLCPYLTAAERGDLLADARTAHTPPSVVELLDAPGERGFRVHRLTFGTGGARRRRPTAYEPVSMVLEALAPETVAVAGQVQA
jgi:hypothetical protein